MRRRYRKKAGQFVTAVQLNLDIDTFTFTKWGAQQRCKRGDWIVDDRGETHTVDKESFARTYRLLSPGVYRKISPVWAEIAGQAGAIRTKEGVSHYGPGDYLVFNTQVGDDGYCVPAPKFESMYEIDE